MRPFSSRDAGGNPNGATVGRVQILRLFFCAAMSKLRTAPESANGAIEDLLHSRIQELEDAFSADVLSFSGPIARGFDDEIRDALEFRFGMRRSRKAKLCVILETDGGYIEVTERIANTFRKHYRRVDFFVPSHAFSAGTVLVLSGDAIHMDYYSNLGPIDPQVEKDGRWVPAFGYLEQYKRLVQKSKDGTLTGVEAASFVEHFNPAELYQFEQAIKLSNRLLKKWLVQYKFRNWKRTENHRQPVTKKMKERRAEEIAQLLGNTDEWHSHARGISMEVLRRKVRLKIDDFGENKDTGMQLKRYHKLLVDYMRRIGARAAIHVRKRFLSF